MRFPQLIIAGWRSGECEQALYVYVDDEAEPRKATNAKPRYYQHRQEARSDQEAKSAGVRMALGYPAVLTRRMA